MTNLKSSNDGPVTNLWQVVSRQMTLLWRILAECDHFMKIPRWSCEADWLICDEFLCHVTILWRPESRQQTILWTLCEDFMTTFNAFQSRHMTSWWLLCNELLWLVTTFWRLKIIFRRLFDDSVKMFNLSDDFATVTESLYDDLETTLWQASMKGQLYNNSMTALQIFIWRPCDHAVSCDYTVTTLDAENKRSPISSWQICRHRWHRNLS